MAQAHAAVGMALIGGAILFTLAAAVAVALGGGSWIEGVRVALTTALGIQVTLGVASFLNEARPAGSLHLLYGVLALVTLPFASFFAGEAPPGARAKVLTAGGLVTTGLMWRLAVTG
ncbi:MAG TPA: hypothetical protein VM784_02205 [Actinomycetota bacterium]|nr:hypothetical protein [Actinomycetota bacterium]